MNFYQVDASGVQGALYTSITDTSSGSVTLACGEKYVVETRSTSGAAGDSAIISSANLAGATIDSATGKLTFTPTGNGGTLTVMSHQHGNSEVRAFDLINNAFLFDDQDASATDYETTDGVKFNGTTVGDNGITVGSGGELRVRVYYRANQIDEDANDIGGTYVLVDAATSAWDGTRRTMTINGVISPDVTTSLNADEKSAYSNYEYVYKIPAGLDITNSKETLLDFSLFAKSGQNPTGAHNVSIDFAPIGKFASQLNSDTLKIGSVLDDSANTDVHTRFDTEFAIA